MKTILAGLALAAAGIVAAVLVAQEGRKVSGVVFSEASGRPIANADVAYAEDGTTQRTVTDSKGEFEFPAGRLGTVTVTATSFGTAYRRWPPRDGGTLRIGLTPPVTGEGTVVDTTTSQPLAATVTALVRHPASFVSTGAIVEGGTFRIDDLPAGPGVLIANANGYAPVVSQFATQAGDWHGIDIRLPPEARATGSVLDGEAEPVVGAHLDVNYGGRLTGAGFLGRWYDNEFRRKVHSRRNCARYGG